MSEMLVHRMAFAFVTVCISSFLMDDGPLVAQVQDKRRLQELEAKATGKAVTSQEQSSSSSAEVGFVSADPSGRLVKTGSLPQSMLPKNVSGVAVPWRKSQSPIQDDLRCGVKALFVFLRMHDVGVTLADLEKELTVGQQGVDMLQLKEVARRHGVDAKVVKCSPSDLAAALPAIVRTSPGSGSDVAHYQVVTGVSEKEVFFVEPTTCRFENAMPASLTRYFTGHALVADPRGAWAPVVSFFLVTIILGQVVAIGAMWRKRRRGVPLKA